MNYGRALAGARRWAIPLTAALLAVVIAGQAFIIVKLNQLEDNQDVSYPDYSYQMTGLTDAAIEARDEARHASSAAEQAARSADAAREAAERAARFEAYH